MNTNKDAVKPQDVGTWRPICYYVDVTFNAGNGKFQDGEQKHIVNGKKNELYRTENLTEAMVTAIGTPKQSGYHFAGWSLKPNGSVDDVLQVADGYMTIDNNDKNDFGGVEDGMTLYAVYTLAASVKINDIAAGEEIKAGKEHEFTLTGNENTDTGATVTLALNGSTNAKLEYYNSTTEKWQEVPDALKVSDVNGMRFRVAVPKNADNATVTLTAVVKDAKGNEIEDGGDSKTFTVNKYVNAEVTITGLDGTTVKAGEAKDFTVNVTPHDDTIDKVTFGTTSGEVQWSNDGGNTWTTVSGDVDYSDLTGKQFRVVPAADAANGTVTVTVIAKKADGTEVAKKGASFTVTAREHATVAINNLNGETIKQNKAHTFTVTVTAHDDSGNMTVKFDSVEGLIYNDAPVTDEGITIEGLTAGETRTLNLIITPDEAGNGKTLKATLNNDATDTATYNVSAYEHAKVTITGLDGTTVKAGEAKEFTVSVTPNDDANTGAKATITVSGANADAVEKIQYKDGATWKDVPGEGLSIDKINNTEFKLITKADANDGDVTITVTANKADGTEVAKKDANFTVTKKEEPVTPGGGSTGGGENPGENPGGGSTGDSGNTKPTPKPDEKPDRKIKIDGGIVEVNGKEVKPDEDGNITVKKGDEITVTVDKSKISDAQVFDQWVIKPDSVLNEVDPKSEKISFTMPAEDVTIEAMTRDASIEDDGPGILGTGALIATGVVGSAALLYQGHMLGTELYLRYLLPHGAVIPQNRAELAVLLWQDAENPEPVSTTLYSDISDEDSAIQQAARWAVENDLMEQLDAEEHPDHFDPFVPVTFSDSIRAWKKAQELKKSVH